MKYSITLTRQTKFTDANGSLLLLKGMWCHKRPLSTAITHSAADFSANNGRNLVTAPSTLLSYLFFFFLSYTSFATV